MSWNVFAFYAEDSGRHVVITLGGTNQVACYRIGSDETDEYSQELALTDSDKQSVAEVWSPLVLSQP